MRLVVQADKGYTPLKLKGQNVWDTVTTKDLDTWKMKTLHEEFTELSTGKSRGQSILPMWPSKVYICPETESFTVAIQDQVIKTRNYESDQQM
jgi:hypothetical protein